MVRELPYVGPPEGGVVFRVARSFDVFAPPDWEFAEEDGTFGNRFDDPGAYRGIKKNARFRVVYCASQRAGAFGETISRYRRSATLVAALEQIDDEDPFEPELEGGIIPEGWRLERYLSTTRLDENLLFADFAAPESFQILTEQLAALLIQFGLTEFDLSVITSRQRRLTQEAARYVYDLSNTGITFSGIRYLSRLNPNWELWAIFHDRMIHTPEDIPQTIRYDDIGLMEAASALDVKIR